MRRPYDFYTYIMASMNGTLYVGMTNNIVRRAREHKLGMNKGFTKRYGCHRLVYVEHSPYVLNAIAREKEIKNMSRVKKEALIREINPQWADLAKDWDKEGADMRQESASTARATRASE
ncbi:MAG TPA: GIY-YIG nuclease family protein [Candidatus Methylomirabilis sp.]|nr:GIY-YIG nuclease family protein [Candidatus Methylomirabilis sp.]